MEDHDDRIDLDDRVLAGFRRGITRRVFLNRATRSVFALGATGAFFAARAPIAQAANCSVYGIDPEYGCTCASTPTCLGGQCNDGTGNCVSGYQRCTKWATANAQGQYCWCSSHCYNGSQLGFYTCCDCYTTSGSPPCNRSATHCICPQWHAA